MKNYKKIGFGIISGLALLSMTACGSSGTAYYEKGQAAPAANGGAMYGDYEYAYDADEYYLADNSIGVESEEYYDDYSSPMGGGYDSGTQMTGTELEASVAKNRKLIKTVHLSVETTKYDEMISSLRNEINAIGGYIEYEQSYNGSIYDNSKTTKNASITVRVPDDKLDEFVNSVAGIGSITSKSTSTEDITLHYVDTESKKEMLQAEQESILGLLEKAESIEDITYLTERLTQIRYEIESMESSLRVYDDLVAYATVNININEVAVLTPTVVEEKTLSQEMKEGFQKSIDDIWYGIKRSFVNFVIRLPYLVKGLVTLGIIAGIGFAIVRIIIAIVKKNNKKKYEKYLESKNDSAPKTNETASASEVKEKGTDGTESK